MRAAVLFLALSACGGATDSRTIVPKCPLVGPETVDVIITIDREPGSGGHAYCQESPPRISLAPGFSLRLFSHEVGHMLGLGHNPDPMSAMYHSTGPLRLDSDMAGIRRKVNLISTPETLEACLHARLFWNGPGRPPRGTVFVTVDGAE